VEEVDEKLQSPGELALRRVVTEVEESPGT